MNPAPGNVTIQDLEATDNNRFVHIRCAPILLPFLQQLVEAYANERPEVRIAVMEGQLFRGLWCLPEGSADLALVAATIPGELVRRLDRASRGVRVRMFAADAIAVIVHPDNPVDSLTREDLRAIFSGRVTDWLSISQSPREIRLYVPDPTQGINQAWRDSVMGDFTALSPRGIPRLQRDLVSAVSVDRGGIGFLSNALVNESVKVVKINNVAPTPDTIRSRQYPLWRGLFVVTRAQPRRATTDFLNFMAAPRWGGAFLSLIGAVPTE